jgi:hypothetical protein
MNTARGVPDPGPIVTACQLAPVWVMPEGSTGATFLARMRAPARPVAARGWSLTGCRHVLLWEDERGH